MAVPEIDSVESVTTKLQSLLLKAEGIKRTAEIDPPLPAETFENAPSPIVTGTDNTTLTRGILERAARIIFYKIAATTSIDDPSFVQIWNLLDILQYYEDRGQTPPALVLWLLEELLDSQNIDGCRRVFDYMESRREILIANNFAKNKDLVILRCCNELLRRLSRAEDAAFCGRVFIFLFLSFPLGDKSSVNPRGEFHVENVTTFEESSAEVDPDVEPMAVDAENEGSATGDSSNDKNGSQPIQVNIEGVSIDEKKGEQTKTNSQKTMDTNTLYPIFWTLQQAFSDPTRLFADDYFDGFKRGLEATLAKFKEVPKVISAKGDHKRGLVRQENESHDDLANTFNPKYLTSRDLFKLELSDLSFQRHILVQALILVDFLLSLTQRSKERLAQLNTNKALRYAYTLSEENAEWTLGIKKAIAAYLQDGPDGKFYYRMIDTVLSRDKNWVRWKLENCPEIKRPPVSPQIFQEAKSGAKKTSTTRRLKAAPMGSLDLGFLTESDGSNLLDALKQPERFTVPSMESYAKGIANIDLDLDFATTEEEKHGLEEAKASKTWRALRIASRTKLGRFDKIEDGKNLDSLFVEPEPTLPASSNNGSGGGGGGNSVDAGATAAGPADGDGEAVAAAAGEGTGASRSSDAAGELAVSATEAVTTAGERSSSSSEGASVPDTAARDAGNNNAKMAAEAPEGQGMVSVAEQDDGSMQTGLEEGRAGSVSQMTASQDSG